MTDHLPSKDVVHQLRTAAAAIREYAVTTGVSSYGSLYDKAADEIERLRACLSSVSGCGSCEACRGAALRALGCEWCQQGIPKSADGRRHESEYGVWGCAAQPSEPRDGR